MNQPLMRTLAALAFAALAAGTAHAAQWARTYGSQFAESGAVTPRPAGGFWLQGTTGTASSGVDTLYGQLGPAGAALWAKRLGGAKADNLFVQPVAGGYLVSGSTRSFPAPGVTRDNLLWARFDSNWNPVYAKVFGGAATAESGSFAKTADGGLLFAGSRTSYPSAGSSDSDILLIRTRLNGTVQWKQILSHGLQDSATQSIELSDGFVVAGMLQDPALQTWGMLVMKLDKASGAILWKNLYTLDTSTTLDRIGSGGSITKLADGSFVISGTLQPLNPLLGATRTVLARIGATGALQWSQSYAHATSHVMALNVTELASESALLVSGSLTVADLGSPNYGKSGVLAMKVATATGDVLLNRRIGALAQYNVGSVIKSGTVVYLSGQHAPTLQDFVNKPRVLYARLNASTLQPLWSKTFGGAYREAGFAQKTASGYLLGGTTYSFGLSTETKGDLFGVTLDATGSYPGCPYVAPVTLATSIPGITAAPVALLRNTNPALTAKPSGAASAVVLPVTDTQLPSTDICSPITG